MTKQNSKNTDFSGIEELHNLEVMKNYKGKVESGEISIFEDQDDPREISTAIFARWESKDIN